MIRGLGVGVLVAAAAAFASEASAQTTVNIAWCARTVSSAAAPFAVATKMGWFAAIHLTRACR
jgi:NitT/TauT family transport system substrate-binding protein